MRKLLLAAALTLSFAHSVNAQTVLNHYQAGPRLIDGTQLNLMVDQVNNLSGNGTPGAITGTTGTFSSTLGVTGVATFTAIPVLPTGGATFGSTTITEAEIGTLDGVTPGTALASKALVLDSSKGIATITSATITTLTSTTLTGTTANLSGHINTGSGVPAVTSCGTGSPTITGSDTAGIVTLGTGATGCVITFAVAYTGTPYCVVSWIATPLASQSYVTANTAITLTQTSTSGNKVQYVCAGPSGG